MNLIGSLAAIANVVLDVFYAYTTTYSVKMIFLLTCILIGVRILVIFLVGQCYYGKFVRRYRLNLSKAVEEQGVEADEQDSHDEDGNTSNLRHTELTN